MPDGREWPRVTVITPSFNQARFIEETLRSVLLQGYPNLEYLVLDGGSSDGSVEVIKKYARWINYWASEPDGGQSAAINRGLEMGSGAFAAWVNSDDMLYHNALVEHAGRIGFENGVVYVGTCALMDVRGKIRSMRKNSIHTLEELLRVPQIWRQGRNIVQPEVMFSRALALEVGGLDVENHYSMDYELWGKFFLAGAKFRNTDVPFGMLRLHADQKTKNRVITTQSMTDSALKLIDAAESLPEGTKRALRADLSAYLAEYPEREWKNSGRLARLGLPRTVVARIRREKRDWRQLSKAWREVDARRNECDVHDEVTIFIPAAVKRVFERREECPRSDGVPGQRPLLFVCEKSSRKFAEGSKWTLPTFDIPTSTLTSVGAGVCARRPEDSTGVFLLFSRTMVVPFCFFRSIGIRLRGPICDRP